MKKQLTIMTVCIFVYISTIAQPPIKKLVFKGYRYEYEKEKRGGEIVLSGTYPEAMTKEYKTFRSDSIKIVQDSLNKKNKNQTIKNVKNK